MASVSSCVDRLLSSAKKRYRFGDSLVSTVKIVAHYQAIGGVFIREKKKLIRNHHFRELRVIASDHLSLSVRNCDLACAIIFSVLLTGINVVKDLDVKGFGRQVFSKKAKRGE